MQAVIRPCDSSFAYHYVPMEVEFVSIHINTNVAHTYIHMYNVRIVARIWKVTLVFYDQSLLIFVVRQLETPKLFEVEQKLE